MEESTYIPPSLPWRTMTNDEDVGEDGDDEEDGDDARYDGDYVDEDADGMN